MNVIWKSCSPKNFRTGRAVSSATGNRDLHVSDGCLSSADSGLAEDFNNPSAEVSAHYIVAKTGEVHQYVKEEDMSVPSPGAPLNPTWKLLRPGINPNDYTIGIEHEGKATDPWPDAQYQASAELVAAIAQHWSIPIDPDHIVLHREIHGDRPCPGFIFDRTKLLGLIASPTMPSSHLPLASKATFPPQWLIH